MHTYNISEFAELVGVSVKTLQRWDREGRLVPDRTITNRRIYDDHDLAKALGRTLRPEKEREVIGYVRVSTRNQKPDLANQRAALETFCLQYGHNVTTWIEDWGSGLNFKRRGLRRVITMIVTGRVCKLVVAHQDRLARCGFELIEFLCTLSDCELIVVDGDELSPEAEMVQDVLAILQVFSARLDGLRSYQKKIAETLKRDQSLQNTTASDA